MNSTQYIESDSITLGGISTLSTDESNPAASARDRFEVRDVSESSDTSANDTENSV